MEAEKKALTDGAHHKPAGAKPSKVEAVKLASEYLNTFVANELDNGPVAFHRGRGDDSQVSRLVPAGRP